jgi:hypothetical protein
MEPGFPMRGQSLDDIVVDPQGGLYVGYWTVATNDGGGVARSTDGGQTFTLLPGIKGQTVRALAQAPVGAERAGRGHADRRLPHGRRRPTWQRISPEGHIDLKNVGSVAFDPGQADTIYAGHLAPAVEDEGRRDAPGTRSRRA